MPKAATHALIWSTDRGRYELYEQGTGQRPLFLGDDAPWFAWLADHTSFSFQGQEGHANLLKETRKNQGDGYWYAYRRQGKRTVKTYAGRSATLSMARLEAAARALAAGAAPTGAPTEAPTEERHDATEAASDGEKQTPLLEPKLLLPRLHQPLVDRERLLARLDAAPTRKLTVLSAPAGCGKTTLVRQWIADRSSRGDLPPVAWVSLDGGDNDPVRFWRYVITACQAWQADGGQSALALLAASAQPPFDPPPVATVVTALLNALTQSGQRGILVLEDFHVITAPALHESVAFFLDHLPTTLHLIVLSRGDLPLPLARLRASGDLCEVHAADLRFSPDETQEFLTQTLGEPPAALSPETVSRLETRLEGWAAGLRLLALLLQGRMSQRAIEQSIASLAGSHRPVQEYFVTEVLNAQPEPLQHFLLQTTLFSRLNGSLCDAVLDRHDSDILLDALERAGLFLERLDGPEQWYRYHALFAEAMQAEARRRLGAGALQALSRRASEWYEAHGMLAEAIEAALTAGDMVRAAGLIEQRMGLPTFGQSPESHTLRRWLAQLPTEILQRHPALCLGYALALMLSNVPNQPAADVVTRAHELLATAEAGWRAVGNTAKLGEVCAFRAMSAQRQRQQEQAVAWARQGLEWLPVEEQPWRAICVAVLGWDAMLEGQLNAARQTFTEMRALWNAIGNVHAVRSSRIALGWVYLWQAQLHLAAEHLRPALTEAREFGDHDDIALAQQDLSELHYEWNELDQAAAAAQEVHDLGVQLGEQRLQVPAALMLARVAHARGQVRLTQQRLAALIVQILPEREPHLYREVLTRQARLLLAAGDRAAAQRCLTALADLAQAGHESVDLLAARLLLAEGKAHAALDLLARLLTTAREAGRTRSALEIQLLMALAHAAARQVQDARQLLHTVLAQVQGEGYIRLFLDEGEALASLLRTTLPFLRERSVLAYARAILSAFAPQQAPRQTPPDAAASPDELSLTEPLSPQEQRVLRLLAAGLSNPEIARELVVSVNTVKAHVKSIYRKLDVRNRREAAAATRHWQL